MAISASGSRIDRGCSFRLATRGILMVSKTNGFSHL
jgi:hypothetical protein